MSGTGRVAWITGGATGVGLATAEMLAERGWSVIVSSRRAENVEEAVRGIAPKGEIEGIALDVSKAHEVEAAVKKILAAHGRIDLPVNSAGINVRHRNWPDFTREGWDQVIGINLNGLLYCMRAVLPAMRARKEGAIVNVSSWAVKFASPLTGPAYSASKHAVVALTHELNMENFRDNLRACCICLNEIVISPTWNRIFLASPAP